MPPHALLGGVVPLTHRTPALTTHKKKKNKTDKKIIKKITRLPQTPKKKTNKTPRPTNKKKK
ncbi:hypothetical protein, partial [Enterobacter hormaechei]